ncbi:1-deoxy-D-xylulose-5-phosphate synthase [Lentzea xinjiangensis]|uniref:1-deoxy-D-xylulose-5-phosphate synthase n=1 Tax=Lentzea xinjiangensis TaxID=402600 RepID=A0A1H9LPG4_9PSEU|nr:1-deoxy-D-xylulose-5-phosphate synthase [Lentzea xinjiangensis]SER13324.1 1-deoxy-D-xylulose-5-phosphate synthase [Lentzea xinjiangensis]
MTRQTAGPPALLGLPSGPEELRDIAAGDLPGLAIRIRRFLVDAVLRTGGHLGPNLGVVELTIALHRVFDTAHDRVLFDTGHQAYVHKVLTGRWDRFDTLRQAGGLSGYPDPAESEHDLMRNSHASTALSYADGLATALRLRGDTRHVVAVVGDGALTGGMAWEALNNLAAAPDRPLVIVLNDNGRSYAPTVGAIADHLGALRARAFDDERGDPWPGFFGILRLSYLGPVDGHDTAAVEHALRQAKASGRTVVVHCVTTKGKGHPPAENDEADCQHAVNPRRTPARAGRSWTQEFAEEIVALGARNPDVVCLTAAMLRPTGLHPFARRFPHRVFDVGLAEQHAVTAAAGLAMGGLHPVVAVYSTFLTRAFDQVLMDVALHGLPVTFVLDRAGITGPDGASHHGMWDACVLPAVPGIRIAEPRDPARLRELLQECLTQDTGPTVLRFPKGRAGPDLEAIGQVGGVDLLRADPSATVLLVAVGGRAEACLRAADLVAESGIAVTVADPRWTTPLPEVLGELAARHRLTVTVEDNAGTGGFGQRLAHLLSRRNHPPRLRTLALPTEFLPHGERPDLLHRHHLDATGIAETVRHHVFREDTMTNPQQPTHHHPGG